MSVGERKWSWDLDNSFQNLPQKVKDNTKVQNLKPFMKSRSIFKIFKTSQHYIYADGGGAASGVSEV